MNVVAIDGPAASGKSTVARTVAKALGYGMVNSGNLYRAVTSELHRLGCDIADPSAVEAAMLQVEVRAFFAAGDALATVEFHGSREESQLRSPLLNSTVSAVSAYPCVRAFVVRALRDLATQRPLVMEGRDIGTAVFPDSRHKFFLDASPEVREQRRRAQGEADSIHDRDRQDSSRATAPLTCAPDATLVDTSTLTIGEVAEKVLAILRQQGVESASP